MEPAFHSEGGKHLLWLQDPPLCCMAAVQITEDDTLTAGVGEGVLTIGQHEDQTDLKQFSEGVLSTCNRLLTSYWVRSGWIMPQSRPDDAIGIQPLRCCTSEAARIRHGGTAGPHDRYAWPLS